MPDSPHQDTCATPECESAAPSAGGAASSGHQRPSNPANTASNPEPVGREADPDRGAFPGPGLPELNPIIHGKLRLAVLSLLIGVDQAEFTWLRDKTGSSDGNLGAHLLKLEEAGYIASEKKFVQRKPVSLYRITTSGREEFAAYIRALKVLLGGALQPG